MPAPSFRGPYPRPRLRAVPVQRNPEAVPAGLYEYVGCLLGAVGACIAFFGAYFAAISSTGWVVGLALGWITAWLAASVAFVILRHLWPFAVVLLIAFLR
jgi:hypothetical protein